MYRNAVCMFLHAPGSPEYNAMRLSNQINQSDLNEPGKFIAIIFLLNVSKRLKLLINTVQ